MGKHIFVLIAKVWISLLLAAAQPALATGLAFQNIDAEEFKGLVQDFSANLTHTSVSGASAISRHFGFQFGVLTGRTNTPHINQRVQEVIPGRTRDSLPHIHVLGALTVPLGFTIEAGYLPKTGTNDFKYTTFGLAAKWTPTHLIEESWLHFALKGHLQKSYVEFDYELNNTPTRYEYRGVVSGATAILSADITPMIEPYAGVGVVTGTGELKASGSSTVFADPEFQAASAAKATVTSPLYMLGIEFKMGVMRFGLEYSRQFGTDTYNGKFTFVP